MKLNPLPFAVAIIAASVFPQSANAQRPGDERYQQGPRFPVLRKAFRQIRSDVRYHATTLRHTARDMRHDITDTIRGEFSPPRPPAYGYRGAPAPQDFYEDPRRTRPDQFEPRPLRQPPRVKRSIPRPPDQPEAEAERPVRDLEPEPEIVAPRKEQKPATQQPKKQPAPEPKKETAESQKKGSPKPVRGKIAYPEAKPSKRKGFHYSPYEPYELLDTQDIKPGGLARDPGNGKIFRIPK